MRSSKVVISLIRYQGKYFRSPVNFSLSRLGLFVLVSGQWNFVCRNQSGQTVTATARCDLFSASLPLPPRFFPSLPSQALPGDITTAPGMQLGGDPAPTPAAPGLFLLFFSSCLGALLLAHTRERCWISGWRGASCGGFDCRGSSFLAEPWTADASGSQGEDAGHWPPVACPMW